MSRLTKILLAILFLLICTSCTWIETDIKRLSYVMIITFVLGLIGFIADSSGKK